MRILVISNLYPPGAIGGYEIGCSNVARELHRQGHEVFVLTSPSHVRQDSPGPDQDRSSSPVVIRRLQECWHKLLKVNREDTARFTHFLSAVSNYENTHAVLDVIEEVRPDCVYLFNLVGVGGLAILDALNSIGMPWTIHLMDRVPEFLQGPCPPDVLEIFHAKDGALYDNGNVISMSNHLLKEIDDMCGTNFLDKAKVVPGWAVAPSEIVKRDYAAKSELRFVTACQIQEVKGIGLTLEAAARLKMEKVNNFHIEIYGKGQVSHYVDVARELGVSTLVSFPGERSQPELYEIYRKADAFLFPTWEREPFGFAPVEAAAMGCIPIITATCGVAERLVHQVHCYKIQRDVDSLASAMKLFCTGEVSYRLLGENAQRITRKDLSFSSCVRSIVKILESSIRTSRTRVPDWRDINRTHLKHNLAMRSTLKL